MVRAVPKGRGDFTLGCGAGRDMEVVSRGEGAVDGQRRCNERARSPPVDEGEDSGDHRIVRGRVTTANEVLCAEDPDIGPRRQDEDADGESPGEEYREPCGGMVCGGTQSEDGSGLIRSPWR